MDRLAAFAALVRKWSPRINLVAPGDLDALESRHIADCVPLAAVPAAVWADLGSGGGFPGIVVAALKPETAVHLVEADARKAAFLRSAVRELALANATVHVARAEALAPLGADVVSARALAPLPRLLPWVARHLAPGGLAVLPKGARWQTEVAQARATWHFDLEAHPGAETGAILHVRNLSPAPRDGDREPEGRGRQDHDRGEPGGGAGRGRP